MVFSSPIFLFLFLPLAMVGTVCAGRRFRNGFLLAVSLLFYAWGEPVNVLVMLLSILINFAAGLGIARGHATGAGKTWLAVGIIMNLLLLGHFKYADFLIANLNHVLSGIGAGNIPQPGIELPIGISFFTFQAISYLMDVHRRHVPAESSLVNLGLYIAMFPQLIAGPIVRYEQIAAQMRERTVTLPLFSDGITRFVIGLAKKMLLANPAGAIADAAFGTPDGSLSASFAWFGAACYGLQIYFDFSGYSDMAIGLGKMFGFEYEENFRHPYSAQSVREFWRRWHISLSTWFRDYLYVPLGGNQTGVNRTYWNLFVVFSLCGLWHGASWNFLIWGWLHGSLLILERVGLGSLLDALPRPLRHGYTLLAVLIGWVIFRSETPVAALNYFEAMAGSAGTSGLPAEYINFFHAGFFAVACLAATPAGASVADRLKQYGYRTRAGTAAFASSRLTVLASLLIASASFVAADTYNPFIYFRF